MKVTVWHHYIAIPSKTGDFRYVTYVNNQRRMVCMEKGRCAMDYGIRMATEVCEALNAKGTPAFIIKTSLETQYRNI